MTKKDLTHQLHEAERSSFEADARLKYLLARFGDQIAEQKGYKTHKGLGAIHFYLVQTYRWPPSLVRSMNDTDLQFLLAEEMQSWTLPEAARV